MNTADVVIVGAGAAGLATAIFLGRAAEGRHIVVLDGARTVGAKILVSGGGRCNVTNVRTTPADFYGGNPNVIRRVLAGFSEADARAFFEEIGVALHEEENGKLFPDSHSARTVVEALLAETRRLGIDVRAGCRVENVAVAETGFEISVRADDEPESWCGRYVVLATGGLSLPKTGSDGFGYTLARRLGHDVSPTTPALDPLLLDSAWHAGLSGISQDVRLTVHVEGVKPVRVAGAMLWTHFGISGPVALNVSRFWNRAMLERRAVRITADFTGLGDFSAVEPVLLEAARFNAKTRVANVLRTWLPLRVADAICLDLGIGGDQEIGRLTRENRRRLVHELIERPLPVVGTRGYRYAEVTAGGVPLSQIDTSTMSSRVCDGLFLVGEILDVDGRIGGFNFQWAWSSGYAAGCAIARRLTGS